MTGRNWEDARIALDYLRWSQTRNRVDISGKRFGRLVVLEYGGRVNYCREHKETAWLCSCDCGKRVIVRLGNLRDGTTKSCGCFRADSTRKRFTKYGTAQQLIEANRASHRKYNGLRVRDDASRVRHLAYSRKSYRKAMLELSDGYVRRVLSQSKSMSQLLASDIPAPLVEAKRAHLKVQRLLKG